MQLDKLVEILHRNMMKILTSIFALSILTVIIFWLFRESPELIPGGDLAFTMLCNLAYGFIASYLFYLINVYVPETRKQNRHLMLLANALAKIEYNLRKVLDSYTMESKSKNDAHEVVMQSKFEKPIATALVTSGTIVLSGYFPDDSEASTLANKFLETVGFEELKKNSIDRIIYSPQLAAAITLQSAATVLDQTLFNATALADEHRLFLHGVLSSTSTTFRFGTPSDLANVIQDINELQLDCELRTLRSNIDEFYKSKNLPKKLRNYLNQQYIDVQHEAEEQLEDLLCTCIKLCYSHIESLRKKTNETV